MYYSTFSRFLSPPFSPHLLLSHHSRALSQKELKPGVPLRALLPPPHYSTRVIISIVRKIQPVFPPRRLESKLYVINSHYEAISGK